MDALRFTIGGIIGAVLFLLFIYVAFKLATAGILHARRDFARHERLNNRLSKSKD
jgi:O-antigen ligase